MKYLQHFRKWRYFCGYIWKTTPPSLFGMHHIIAHVAIFPIFKRLKASSRRGGVFTCVRFKLVITFMVTCTSEVFSTRRSRNKRWIMAPDAAAAAASRWAYSRSPKDRALPVTPSACSRWLALEVEVLDSRNPHTWAYLEVIGSRGRSAEYQREQLLCTPTTKSKHVTTFTGN